MGASPRASTRAIADDRHPAPTTLSRVSNQQLTLDLAQGLLAAQPFSSLIGARLTEFGADAAVLEIEIRDELRQQNGFVHGGVLSYAADNALTFAGGTALGAAVLTGGFTISFLRPVDGRTVRAHATVVHATSRQAVCRCDIYALDDGAPPVLCATAQGTVVAAPGRSR
ncbi:MAG: hotdog fold thioesterase [Propionibacteriales bacterium]|nr:hotdog fold thioesterase [Propionibacteriales bacterium]